MKKPGIILLIGLMAVIMTACSDNSTGEDKNRDTTPPQVVATNPPGDDPANEVSVFTSIEIAFSEPIDCTSIDASMVDIGPYRTGSVACDSNVVLYDPDLGFDFAVLVQVTVKAGIKDLAGNAMAEDYTFQFYTEVEPGK